MISPFSRHNLIRILIPTPISLLFFRKASFLLFLILTQFVCFSCSFVKNSVFASRNSEEGKDPVSKTMKIHPLPKKRNIAVQYDMNRATNRAQKLRRLPHIFSRVLELPFTSDAEVAVEESPDCFKFVVEADGISDVRAHAVEIYPGVTKIVIRPGSRVDFTYVDDLELDRWRFRLPESTRPELASAVYKGGELIVTVPKGAVLEAVGGGGGGGNREFRGGMGNGNNNNRLVLVQ